MIRRLLPFSLVLLLTTPACIFVHVSGDLGEGPWLDGNGGEDLELETALGDCLRDPEYDLDIRANPWNQELEWTVKFASAGSDGAAAFHRAKEAVLARIRREEGLLIDQEEEGTHAWSCSFQIDGEPGEASVRLVENANEGEERPHQLELTWEESD